MGKIRREDKIDLLVQIYFDWVEKCDNQVPVVNQIIIDSIGINGLKEVKRRAWKNHY